MSVDQLGDHAEVFNGKTPSKTEQRDRGHPVLKIRDVDEVGQFRRKYESFVDQDFARRFQSKQVKAGDTLILNAAHNADYVGSKTFFADSQVEGAIATGEWLIVRPDQKTLDSRYASHWITSASVRREIRELVKGIHLYPKDVARLPIPLPPLEEQKRIAAILDQANDLRRKRQHALTRLNQLGQAIFYEMFGNLLQNEKAWPNGGTLGDHAAIASGITKGRDPKGRPTRTVPYLAVVNVQDKRLQLDSPKEIEATEDEILRYRLQPGDLLLTEGGDPDKLGRGTLWNAELPECIHQNHVFRVRLSSKNYNPIFLNWLVGSTYGKKYFLRSAKQTTGIASINMSQLKAFPMLLPPIKLQEDFARKLKQTEAAVDTLALGVIATDNLFTSLQHRAFGGEL